VLFPVAQDELGAAREKPPEERFLLGGELAELAGAAGAARVTRGTRRSFREESALRLPAALEAAILDRRKKISTLGREIWLGARSISLPRSLGQARGPEHRHGRGERADRSRQMRDRAPFWTPPTRGWVARASRVSAEAVPRGSCYSLYSVQPIWSLTSGSSLGAHGFVPPSAAIRMPTAHLKPLL
jgi:hypothetical protein